MTISAMTLIIALLVAKDVYVNWQQLEKIRSLKGAILMSDKLFDATEKFSEERDIAYTILHAPDADTANKLRARLEERRQAADVALGNGMEALKAYDFVELVKFREAIEKQLLGIRKLREQIDQAAAVPANQRNDKLSDQWFEESTKLIEETQDLWVEFSQHFADIDPIVTQHLRYKHFLRVISDYTGRERAIIGRLIVDNSDPGLEQSAQLLRGQGTLELSWKMADVLATQSGLMTSIAPYYSDARSHYLTLFSMISDTFYVPGGRHGASYPISVDLWFELSSQAKESFDALKDASLKAIHHYVETLETRAEQAIIGNTVLLFCVMVLCAYSFQVVIRRVITPINAMAGALLDTVHGKSVTSLPPIANEEDEIGKLVQALHAFQESGDRYRALVEASSQIIWTWRPDQTGNMGTLFDWWEKITGLPASEMLPYGWASTVHPDDRENAKEIWTHAMETGENYTMEYRLLRREGGVCWVYVRGVGLKNPDGSVRELVGALNDITERKEAEIALKNYNLALERSNKELDDFAYIASHDLKEPLRGLFNHATFLLEDYKDKLDEAGVRKLHRLSYLAQRMERLVNDLLYFSRLGRQDLAIQPTDMNEVIHDIANTIETFIEERHAHIIVPKPLPVITCDKTRITEVFRNLITNAIKYNDKSEKTVEIGFLETHTPSGGAATKNVFYVKDDGKGIPEEFYDEIFRIFKRLQSSKDTAEEGTGVGLTFVKKIVERHGGKIWLESEVGQGTTFYFILGTR